MSLINKIKLMMLLLIAASPTLAQDDQIQIETEEVETIKKERYRYHNIDDYEQRTLFKVYTHTGILFDNGWRWYDLFSRVSLEQKLSPSVSLEAGGMIYPRRDQTVFSGYQWQTQLRYYFNKRANSKATKDRVNNFSGNYLSVNFSRTGYISDSEFLDDFTVTTVGLRLARQQKIGSFGFYDYGVSLRYTSSGLRNKSIGLAITLSDGLAYGKSRSAPNLSKDTTDEDEVDSKWTGGLIGLGNIQVWRDELNTNFRLSPYAEFHLGNYFTLNPSISLYHWRADADFADIRSRRYHASFSLSVRKYLGVKARAAEGKILPKFNGAYLRFGFSNLFEYDRLIGVFEELNGPEWNLNPSVGVGWQENSGKRLQVNFGAGIGYLSSIDKFWLSGGVGVGFILNRS